MTNRIPESRPVISRKSARKFALNAQMLGQNSSVDGITPSLETIFDQLGYVQIDTIAVIERAHHHTLWSRHAEYVSDQLHVLQAESQKVFEYWGHAASYLPIQDYRFYRPVMERFRRGGSAWHRSFLEKYGHLMDPVLKRIESEGPLSSKDFKPPPGTHRGPWWDWKPSKAALELLYWRGDLMIRERRKFQKIYDLTHRVLPPGIDTQIPDDAERGQFFVGRALTAHGLATETEIRNHIHGAGKKTISLALKVMTDSGEICPVSVENVPGKTYFMSSDLLNQPVCNEPSREIHILSPFDNLIILRDRVRRLFDYAYLLECYVPADKRRYGYFTLSVLFGDEFVARLDPKVHRNTGEFEVRVLIFEPDFKPGTEYIEKFAKKLRHFARFNGCRKITLGTVKPRGSKGELVRALRKFRE